VVADQEQRVLQQPRGCVGDACAGSCPDGNAGSSSAGAGFRVSTRFTVNTHLGSQQAGPTMNGPYQRNVEIFQKSSSQSFKLLYFLVFFAVYLSIPETRFISSAVSKLALVLSTQR